MMRERERGGVLIVLCMYLYIGARFLETDNILRSIVKETELYIKYVTVPDNCASANAALFANVQCAFSENVKYAI